MPNVKYVPSYVYQVKDKCPEEIHEKIVSVYGNIKNRQNVAKNCHIFSGGRTNV